MLQGERLVGVFDLDSPRIGRFTAVDQAAIEQAVRTLMQACRIP